jgi:hypothetical protein
MGLPGFSKRNRRTEPESRESPIGSDVNCANCSSGAKSAKLLVVTGEWNFYYCYRCRHWSRSHDSSGTDLFPVGNTRTENSLTWFWRNEKELVEENIKALKWIRSLFSGRGYENEESKLI